MKIRWLILPLATFSLAACESKQAEPQAASGAAPFKHVTDMKQMMNWVLEPSADVVWTSVGTVITAEGEEEMEPKTDEEWEAVRNAAAVVAESSNLLMLDTYARDKDQWMQRTTALIDAAAEVVKAAEAKDKEALFTTGGEMYLACTACHAQYVQGMPAERVLNLKE